MITASVAGTRGATFLVRSRSSRVLISFSTDSTSPSSPNRCISSHRRWARVFGSAVTKNFNDAPGKTTVPTSLPSMTNPGGFASLRWSPRRASRTFGRAETMDAPLPISSLFNSRAKSSPLTSIRQSSTLLSPRSNLKSRSWHRSASSSSGAPQSTP